MNDAKTEDVAAVTSTEAAMDLLQHCGVMERVKVWISGCLIHQGLIPEFFTAGGGGGERERERENFFGKGRKRLSREIWGHATPPQKFVQNNCPEIEFACTVYVTTISLSSNHNSS